MIRFHPTRQSCGPTGRETEGIGRSHRPRMESLEGTACLHRLPGRAALSGDFASAASTGSIQMATMASRASMTVRRSRAPSRVGVSSIGAVIQFQCPPGATLNVTAGELSIGGSGRRPAVLVDRRLERCVRSGFRGAAGGARGQLRRWRHDCRDDQRESGAKPTFSSGNAPYNINSGAAFEGNGRRSISDGYFNNVVLNTDVTGCKTSAWTREPSADQGS